MTRSNCFGSVELIVHRLQLAEKFPSLNRIISNSALDLYFHHMLASDRQFIVVCWPTRTAAFCGKEISEMVLAQTKSLSKLVEKTITMWN